MRIHYSIFVIRRKIEFSNSDLYNSGQAYKFDLFNRCVSGFVEALSICYKAEIINEFVEFLAELLCLRIKLSLI